MVLSDSQLLSMIISGYQWTVVSGSERLSMVVSGSQSLPIVLNGSQ